MHKSLSTCAISVVQVSIKMYNSYFPSLRMVTLSYLYAPCIRRIIGYYYSAYIYKSPPICKAPRCNPSPACTEPNRSATLVAALAWYGLIIAYRAIFVKWIFYEFLHPCIVSLKSIDSASPCYNKHLDATRLQLAPNQTALQLSLPLLLGMVLL